MIALAGASVNSQAVQLEANASIIDSGTTGIVMSDADAGNISAVRANPQLQSLAASL